MKVVYFGTPDFSVEPFLNLINSKHEILALVTQPDRLSNRNKLIISRIKEEAIKNNIKVFQFEKIRRDGFEELKKLDADVFVTCAYGQIISQEIIDLPKYGILNIHASLLPKYRGSSPIQSSILNNDKYSGITIMKTVLKVDAGDILLQDKIKIENDDTLESLSIKLSHLGSTLILKALEVLKNNPKFIKQNESEVTFCNMIKKQDGIINFEESFEEIQRRIRAFYPWPSSFTFLDNKLLKIFKINLIEKKENKKYPFIYIKDNKLLIDSKLSTFEVLELQQEGSRRLLAKDFINGNRFLDKKELKNARI